MGLTESHEPDPVSATFHTWLDHVLACVRCRRTPARHCYDSAGLGDRHRTAARAVRPGDRERQ
ncbi:hypothetical protein [Streptomyces griseiscabiei]|uniref:Uncharacterized protein n=1 Tax=Streptomyces griseiscabiei TaxID=2993540 RepID=A0ABU4LHU4_9ACTN|nr:hypothetical protein [Streptomyces griseiscabiei]MBZ3908124.1 hypothetical protein [Streptomyces griseiscabiei]MDX2915359.1 hypothetical protein [Streptomyces griseiscabiei]